MVLINDKAKSDLENILNGLLVWKRFELSRDFVMEYLLDIVEVCYTIDKFSFHSRSTYELHKKFGKYVYCYKKNQNTSWYIIYNINEKGIIFVEKIINNHLTVK